MRELSWTQAAEHEQDDVTRPAHASHQPAVRWFTMVVTRMLRERLDRQHHGAGLPTQTAPVW